MKPIELKTILSRLHAELADKNEIDEELRALLNDLDRDIHDLLDQSEQADSLKSRTEAVATRFAAKHPRAEAMLAELADALGRMGI
jgi:hypothetical protein